MVQELKTIERLAQTRSRGPKATPHDVVQVSHPTHSRHTDVSSEPHIMPSVGNSSSDILAMQSKIKDLLPNFKVGGGWGSKTNAALNKIISETQDKLELIAELKEEGVKFNFDTYNFKTLSALKTYIPDLINNKLNLDEDFKKEYARTIAKHLNVIKSLNEQFDSQIASKGQFRSLLNNEKPLEQYSSPHQLLLSREDNDQIGEAVNKLLSRPSNETNVPIKIAPPGQRTADGKQLVIDRMPIIALTNREQYLKWAKEQGFDEPAAVSLFHNVIKSQLDKPVTEVS